MLAEQPHRAVAGATPRAVIRELDAYHLARRRWQGDVLSPAALGEAEGGTGCEAAAVGEDYPYLGHLQWGAADVQAKRSKRPVLASYADRGVLGSEVELAGPEHVPPVRNRLIRCRHSSRRRRLRAEAIGGDRHRPDGRVRGAPSDGGAVAQRAGRG